MNLEAQQAYFRCWLDMAGGDIRIVEDALEAVIRRTGRAAGFCAVLNEIQARKGIPKWP